MIKDDFFKMIEVDSPESTMLHYLYSEARGAVLELGIDERVTLALLAGVEVSGGTVTRAFPIQPTQDLEEHENFIAIKSLPMKVLLSDANKETIDLLVIHGNGYEQTTELLEKYAFTIKAGGLIMVLGVTKYPDVFYAVEEFARSRNSLVGLRDFQGAGVAVIRG